MTAPPDVSHQRAPTSAIPATPTDSSSASSRPVAGVGGDGRGDRVHAFGQAALDAGPHGGLVAQVGLEDQLVGAAGIVDEIEVGLHRAADAKVVVGGRLQRLAHAVAELAGVLVEQREIEVELAGKVLVEHRLADAGPLGDLVHRRRVVALGDEDLAGRAEQLPPARLARQPATAGVGSAAARPAGSWDT